ncbi:MAG: hypothetical protein HYX51_06755 [Chloroflexi bacterium]|nr:hypothetical protein [Chloroflexota bacterium]
MQAPAPDTAAPLAAAPAEPRGKTSAFLETFTGTPGAPKPFLPPNWDVQRQSRDSDTWLTPQPMAAGHGADCAPEPGRHEIRTYEDMVFLCRDHLMTSINASGYGVIYLTPPALADFTEGEAVIRFDLSTLRNSFRDWVDIWVSPYADNVALPLDEGLPDLRGLPRNGIHIRMDNNSGKSIFRAEVIRDFEATDLDSNWWTGYESFLTPSATRRDTFELRLSRTRVAFGMPDYGFWWVDENIAPLNWTRGVVQLGHHSYTPDKDCTPAGTLTCAPNTWHWDNVSINPSLPFSIISGDRRYVDASTTGAEIRFTRPAPAGAMLRFAAVAGTVEVSFDSGTTWSRAERQPGSTERSTDPFHAGSFWTPAPPGAQTVRFRTTPGSWGREWIIKDVTLWAP